MTHDSPRFSVGGGESERLEKTLWSCSGGRKEHTFIGNQMRCEHV